MSQKRAAKERKRKRKIPYYKSQRKTEQAKVKAANENPSDDTTVRKTAGSGEAEKTHLLKLGKEATVTIRRH